MAIWGVITGWPQIICFSSVVVIGWTHGVQHAPKDTRVHVPDTISSLIAVYMPTHKHTHTLFAQLNHSAWSCWLTTQLCHVYMLCVYSHQCIECAVARWQSPNERILLPLFTRWFRADYVRCHKVRKRERESRLDFHIELVGNCVTKPPQHHDDAVLDITVERISS